jgi:hypothetical protein
MVAGVSPIEIKAMKLTELLFWHNELVEITAERAT